MDMCIYRRCVPKTMSLYHNKTTENTNANTGALENVSVMGEGLLSNIVHFDVG